MKQNLSERVRIVSENGNACDLTGQKFIHWFPNDDEGLGLKEAKEFLELNKDNASLFAVFRDGSKPTEYAVITISNDVRT